MKMIKSLILGSAAGLLAIGGAQAADLPVKAKAVEYVRICSLYGAGFFYIPGTDTCIKLGGYLRVDTTFNGGIYNAPAWAGDIGQQNRYRDYFASRSRMALTIDTRTATEYGVVRTFGQGDFQFSTLGASRNPNSLNTSLVNGVAGGQYNGGVLGTNANLLDSPGGGYLGVEMVFIQFAGFTFGKSASAYASPWHGYPGNNSSFLLGGHDTVTGVNNIQYTTQFGNGVSGTIGLDDPTVFSRTAVYNLATPLNTSVLGAGGVPTAFLGATGTQANAYAGTWTPDIVGNIRVDQAWGLFQISAAAHQVNASYNSLAISGVPTGIGAPAPFGPSEPSGHPDSKWGGSVMAALQIKNLPTGAGDDIRMDVSYAKGNTKNVISTSGASPNFAMFSGSGRPGAYNSVGFGVATDAMFIPAGFAIPGVGAIGDGKLHLTEAYGVRGAFNHNWDPYWASSLFGSASAVRYDGTAKAMYCAVYTASAATGGPAGKSADYSCNPDYNVYQVGLVTRWTPVKNLTFSAEVLYFRLDQKFTGTTVMNAVAPKPNGAAYEFKDQDTVSLNVRVQRNF
ncbi:MAG: porin [Rhizobiales bacterium]|nr:porin [Hyphomicrobiales bacterium]